MRDFKDLTWLHILPKKWAETNESMARATIEEAHPVWWLSWCFKTGPCSQLANCGPESWKMVLGSSESPELTWFTGYLQQRSFCRAQKWLYDDPKIAGEHEPLQAGSEYICTCFMWICDRISPNDSLHILRRWVLLFLQLASESNHVFKAVNMLDTSGRGWFPPWQLMMWQLGVMWELQSPFPILRGCRQLLLVKFWKMQQAYFGCAVRFLQPAKQKAPEVQLPKLSLGKTKSPEGLLAVYLRSCKKYIIFCQRIPRYL